MSLTQFRDTEGKIKFFLDSAPVLGAICGVVVWEEEDGSGYVERARFGYGEDGFFYEFMARGQGHIEKLNTRKDVLVFSTQDYELFSEKSKQAVVSGVYEGESFKGFILLEMETSVEYSQIVASLFSHLFERKIPEISSPSDSLVGGIRGFQAIQVLWEELPELSDRLQKLETVNPILVLGPSGSGKKSLARFLHKKWQIGKNFILINSIPEHLGKLEKSLLSWEDLAGKSGVLAFDKISDLSIGQQRIFYEWLEETNFAGKIFFIDPGGKRKEPYPPFWNHLEANSVSLPGLDSLSGALLEKVIYALFQDTVVQLNREGLSLAPEAVEELKRMEFSGNMEELRSILGNVIWKTRTDRVGLEEIVSDRNQGTVNLDLPMADDLDLPKSIEAVERQKILLAQKIFSGNQLRMAKALKISRGSLQYKMRNLGI